MLKQIHFGALYSVLCVVVYKTCLPLLFPNAGTIGYTLILLITPVVLYLIIRKYMIHHWQYRLPFMNVLLFGVSMTVLAGIGIATVDFLVLKYQLPVFGTRVLYELKSPWYRFMFTYITWYTVVGLISSLIIYGILWLQIRSKRS